MSCLWIFTHNIYIGIVNIWSMEPEIVGSRMHRISKLINGAQEEFKKLKILIVGVGGIGCEILKVLAKAPIGQIHILDMDTIEISNLNRQFLFKTCHKGMSKSLVAKETILKLNPTLNIEAHHMNIKDLQISFFRQFGFIIMALDNIEARNYVNRIGVRLNIPIIDAGTLAYKGNATTILRGTSRCYSCEPKSSNQKVFPVCTIRMRPQKPIHCIVWAKMLFEAMFGGNTENDMSDMAELSKIKDELAVLTQLFQKQIEDIKNAKSDTDNKLNEIFVKNIKSISPEVLAENVNKKIMKGFFLHDKVQPLENSIGLFVESLKRLKEEKDKLGAVVFEKDDDDIIHFISAAANLRMSCFSIEQQSFNEVKNMAGNIVPAIASTNSIVSGIEVIEMMKYLRGRQNQMKTYFIQNQKNKIMPLSLENPISTCNVCSPSAIPVTVQCDFNKAKLKDLVALIREKSPSLAEFSLNQGEKEIYNSDEPRQVLLNKTMFELGSSYEFDLILTDEDQMSKVCSIWVVHSEKDSDLKVLNEEILIPKPKEEKMEAESLNNQNGKQQDNGDSDVVIFGDQQSPDLEIIEPMKRERAEGDAEIVAEPQKKKKLE